MVHRNHLCVLLSERVFTREPPQNLASIAHFVMTEGDEDQLTWEELEASYPRYPREDKIILTPEERLVGWLVCTGARGVCVALLPGAEAQRHIIFSHPCGVMCNVFSLFPLSHPQRLLGGSATVHEQVGPREGRGRVGPQRPVSA